MINLNASVSADALYNFRIETSNVQGNWMALKLT